MSGRMVAGLLGAALYIFARSVGADFMVAFFVSIVFGPGITIAVERLVSGR